MVSKQALDQIVWGAITLVVVVSVSALLGWVLDIPFLKSVMDNWISMRIITALSLLCCAGALFLAHRGKDSLWGQRLCLGLGMLVSLSGMVSLFAYNWPLHSGHEMSWVDAPLLRELFSLPARMAPLTAVLFLGFGLVFSLLASSTPRGDAIGHALALPMTFLSYLVLVGYLFHGDELHTWMNVAVAFNTGIAFFAISIGSFCVRPDTWVMRVLTSREVGGVIARRLLPVVVVFPLLIGWLCFSAEHRGALDRENGATLAVIANAVVVMLVIWFAAKSMNMTDERRRRAEEDLYQHREWLRVTLTSIGDAVMTTDTTGRITFINPVASALTGWSREEAAGKPVQEVFRIVNEETLEAAEDIVGRVLREGHVVALANHTALITRQGGITPIEDSAAPIRDNSGNVSGVVVVFYDVTERRKQEEDLLSLNRTLRALSNVNQSMIHAENEQDLLSAVCRIIVEDCGHPMVWIGYAEDEEKSVRPVAQAGFEEGYLESITITWDDSERGRGPTGTTVRTGAPNICQNMLTDPRMLPWRDQAIRRGYASSIALPLKANGETFGALTIYARNPEPFSEAEVKLLSELADDLAYGITAIRMRHELQKSRDDLEIRVQERTAELQKMNEELKTYTTRLEQSNRDLEEFAFIASHDLQEPLRKIQTFAGRVISVHSSSPDDMLQDHLERIKRSAGRMQDLIRDLLKYSRLTSRPEPFEALDLKETVREVTADLRLSIEETGGVIEVGELPSIEADRVQMRQLFQNLIANSLKYCSEERRPIIRVHAASPSPEGFCEICVEDNGIGFDECYCDKIFKPFQRLHGRNSIYQGTGMGLAICRRIVERHGGSITAESAPGRGATFIVILPAKQKG